MSEAKEQVAREILKLMIQAAWADHEVQTEEAEALMAAAAKIKLGEQELKDFKASIAGQKPLPAPDLGLLRAYKTEALTSVRELCDADAHFVSEERELIAELEMLLEGDCTLKAT